jgi:hypothetical protein
MIHPQKELRCDGCGQLASPEHLAGRLRRLEWSTRFRPLHIQTLLLGAIAPQDDEEFVYSDAAVFRGEAAAVLGVAGLVAAGKGPAELHHELQRSGIFVAHVLECPLNPDAVSGTLQQLLVQRLPSTMTRIRRSIKPKRVALISPELEAFRESFTAGNLGCEVVTEGGKAFELSETSDAVERLRATLFSAAPAIR